MTGPADPKSLALFDAVEALKQLGQDYWLCNGTLLGVIRDHRLIPWDVDVDLGVFKEGFDKRAVVPAFESRGFALYDRGEGSDYIVFSKSDVKVDINLFEKRGDRYVSLWRVGNRNLLARGLRRVITSLGVARYPFRRYLERVIYSMEGYSCPEQVLAGFKHVELEGRALRVPVDAERLLEWTYGPPWKTPKRNYDWRKDGANNARG